MHGSKFLARDRLLGFMAWLSTPMLYVLLPEPFLEPQMCMNFGFLIFLSVSLELKRNSNSPTYAVLNFKYWQSIQFHERIWAPKKLKMRHIICSINCIFGIIIFKYLCSIVDILHANLIYKLTPNLHIFLSQKTKIITFFFSALSSIFYR